MSPQPLTARPLPARSLSAAAPVRVDLIDARHQLPKVALGVIGIASMLGVYLTMRNHGGALGWALLRWLQLVSLGLLAGGLMWRGFYTYPLTDEYDTEDLVRFMALADDYLGRVVRIAAIGLAASLPVVWWFGQRAVQRGELALWIVSTLLIAAAGAVTGIAVGKGARAARGKRSGLTAAGTATTVTGASAAAMFRPRWAQLACLLTALALGSTAWLDARLTFGGWLWASLLRPLHVVTFGLWLGGAVWNIFISVPAARRVLDLSVVVATAGQLERFRKTVRVLLPIMVISGILQALSYVTLQSLLQPTSFIAWLVLAKLGLIVGLIVIFITCPMWRACSPIRGMCELEDLTATDNTEAAAAQSAAAVAREPVPDRRLDNRGTACAGFVHIQRTLAEMETGQVLELLSTDPISWWELPAWLEKHAHPLIQQEKKSWLFWRYFRFLFEKGAAD